MGCDLYRASPGFTGRAICFFGGVEDFIKCRSFWMFCKLCILFSDDDDDDDYKTKLVYIYIYTVYIYRLILCMLDATTLAAAVAAI